MKNDNQSLFPYTVGLSNSPILFIHLPSISENNPEQEVKVRGTGLNEMVLTQRWFELRAVLVDKWQCPIREGPYDNIVPTMKDKHCFWRVHRLTTLVYNVH